MEISPPYPKLYAIKDSHFCVCKNNLYFILLNFGIHSRNYRASICFKYKISLGSIFDARCKAAFYQVDVCFDIKMCECQSYAWVSIYLFRDPVFGVIYS